jgi:hypothetical protein
MDKSKWLRLPHGETEEAKRYTMPSPDEMTDAYDAVRRHLYYDERKPTDAELKCVVELACAYLHLTMYELGQECCVEKLRDIWRARRANG